MFNRLGAGSAKRATQASTAFSFPSLGSIHGSIEEMSQEQIQEKIGKAYIAKNNQSSPIMQGIISKNKNGKGGTEEKLIADSICSFPVISDQIVKKLDIRIKPFSQPVNILEASVNSLNLLGSAKLFIQLPQVFSNRIESVEAAVLAGNLVNTELLNLLDLLIAWDLIPPGFPNVILTTYFNQLMKNKAIKSN